MCIRDRVETATSTSVSDRTQWAQGNQPGQDDLGGGVADVDPRREPHLNRARPAYTSAASRTSAAQTGAE